MARVHLTREATRHFDALPTHLQDPVLNALTDLEIDPEAAGKPLPGRLKGFGRPGSAALASSIR